MQTAASYLSYSAASIKEIAHTLGFNDVAYFSNMFKKAHGCPPRRFRQEKAGERKPQGEGPRVGAEER
jgi:AraC-like DNA-binding protein